jgi:trehalose 6-phosphate synthase
MPATTTPENRLVIVSNRLPIVLTRAADGRWQIEPGSGGLINALAPVLRDRGGVWIGWPGVVEGEAGPDLEPLLAAAMHGAGYSLEPVILSAAERDKFYLGFANEVIWPLFHDLQSRCNFDPSYWAAYQAVNHKFAQAIARIRRASDYIWVHDYHLMTLARDLRALGVEAPIGFFLHIPFPPLDIFLKLPWRAQILHALLDYDLIGFQTIRDRHNFVQCVRTLRKDVAIRGKGQVIEARIGDRTVRLGSFPIGIDFQEFARQAASKGVADMAWYIHEALPDRQLILGVDRLDYTKGIPERLNAFKAALQRFPDLRQRVTLIQVVVPSRTDIREYTDLKEEVERLVGEINGQFTQTGWVPIHYIYRHLDRTELLAYYRTCEIALITPLKDGMNLVAKEYCACSLEQGVLILSEFAGAAAQLQRGALMVNPYDVEGVADAIYRAWSMDWDERRARMRSLRRSVREHDIFWWVDSFLRAAIASDLSAFPVLEEYIPAFEAR